MLSKNYTCASTKNIKLNFLPSGPSRFNYDTDSGEWVNSSNKPLNEVLMEEINKL